MPIKMTIIIFKIYRPKRLKKQGRRHQGIRDSDRYWRMESWWIGRIEETEHNFFRTRRKSQAAKAQELGFTERKYEAQIWNSENRLKVCTRGSWTSTSLVTSSYKSSDMRLIPCRAWIKKVLSLRREKFQKSSRGAEGPKIGGLVEVYIFMGETHLHPSPALFPHPGPQIPVARHKTWGSFCAETEWPLRILHKFKAIVRHASLKQTCKL